MSVFGRDKNISCVLVPLEGTTEEAAIFKALVNVLPDRLDWWRDKYWGDSGQTHKILVLCRTQKVLNQVGVVVDIPPDDLQELIEQADGKGLKHHEVQVNELFAMVYY